MATRTLGFKKEKPEPVNFKRLKVEGFEEQFLDYWKSLGFRKELDKNSKSYTNSIKALRKVLGGEYSWCYDITLEKLKHYCGIFKVYTEGNTAHTLAELTKFEGKKLYFHQFVMTYSGFSYLRNVIEGKIKVSDPHLVDVISDEIKDFSLEIEKILIRKFTRGAFSSGEVKRIIKFAQNVDKFFEENKHKIAFGVDKLSMVKGSYAVIDEFRKIKGIPPDLLIYTGNYASGSALIRAMDQFSYWKIYEKHEDDKAIVTKDPDKVRRVIEEQKKKEEENLPDIVKRRREEMRKNGTVCKPKDTDEDCSRRDEYLRKKKEKRNPFGR